MHKPQKDVEEFHRELDINIGDYPAIRRPELRASLIAEEAKETLESITGAEYIFLPVEIEDRHRPEQDLVGAIDGLCDLIVVAYGTAVEFGVDLEPFWDEVHRTNMEKKSGPIRADGKRLKPKNWQPPDIKGILEREYNINV